MAWRRIWRCKNYLAAWNAPQRTARPPHGLCRRSFPLVSGSPLVELTSPPFCSTLGGVRSFRKDVLWSVHRFSSQAWVDLPTAGVVDVPLAQTGEGIAECELLKWFVQEGDVVEEFQRLCEVQSDKATIEITSRYKGKVYQLLSAPGNIVKVGETLLKIIVEEPQTALNSDVPDNQDSVDPLTSELRSQSSLNNKEKAGGVLSSPSVRHLAKQYGLNLKDIQGTGKDGRVLKEDVMNHAFNRGIIKESFIDPHTDPEDAVLLKGETPYAVGIKEHLYEDKAIPIRGFQRAMVKSMTMAAKVPHFHYVEEINCNSLVELKAAFQSHNSDPDVKHTYLPFLIKSLSMALDKHPLLNSSFNEELNEIILKGAHNIGVAMATPFGLVVPNIKKVQSLSILEITKELSRLHLMASNNKLSSEDISGGTISLSNIGTVGGKFGSPLLNLPEVAIVAIGRVQKLPRFADDGTVYPASTINVCIGADHRVVDGAAVAMFCKEWKLLIEKPEVLLLHMR